MMLARPLLNRAEILRVSAVGFGKRLAAQWLGARLDLR
jgi:hypothetical protein